MSVPARDPLAEATGGMYHWDDPGMGDFERGHEEFGLGQRVEVRLCGWYKIRHLAKQSDLPHVCDSCVWSPGVIVETPRENDRAIVVRADERVHDNLANYDGHGLTIMVMHNSRRGIWSNLRTERRR